VKATGSFKKVNIKMISDNYQQQLKELHRDPDWGNTSKIPPWVNLAIESYNIESLLDFGCGKGTVLETLKVKFPCLQLYGYDPVMNNVPLPNEVDMLMSMDVLEHVELSLLDDTLIDLKSRTKKIQYHLIACHKARAVLPDGRNAHLIVETPDWWQRRIRKLGFEILQESVFGRIAPGNAKKNFLPQAEVKYQCLIR